MADHLDIEEVIVLTGTYMYIQYVPSLSRADLVRGKDLVGEAFCTAAADVLFDTITLYKVRVMT